MQGFVVKSCSTTCKNLARENILARFLIVKSCKSCKKAAKLRARLQDSCKFCKMTCKIIYVLQDELYQDLAASCKTFFPGRRRLDSKWQSHLLQNSSVSTKCQPLLAFWTQLDLVVGIGQINLCNTISTSKVPH